MRRRTLALLVVALACLIAAVVWWCREAPPQQEPPAETARREGAVRKDPAAALVERSKAAEREANRLRGLVNALEKRVSELEGDGADGDGAATGDGVPKATLWDDAKTAELAGLRDKMLAGNTTLEDTRRFWTLMREGEPEAPAPAMESRGLPEIWLPLDTADVKWDRAQPVADGARGGAASFHDPAARIDVGPCPMTSRQPFTLRAFLRTRSEGFSTALMARDGEEVGFSLILGRNPGCVSFEAWSWRRVRLTSTTRIDDGAWHEIEVAYDPTTEGALLFIDGRREAAAVLGTGESLTASLRLGNNIGADQPYAGDIDEVSLVRSTSHQDAFGVKR